MGFDAVMTNAYTIYSKISSDEMRTVHQILDFDGSIMTDSGGYQVLEFGSVEVTPEEIAKHEERIGSDIAVILDKPTGLDVTRDFARETVDQTLAAAALTKKVLTRDDTIWTLPIQGGKYLDLVRKSAKLSAVAGYDCFALGSPVEVMEGYDFSLLAAMIISAKTYLPADKPFHLFGAGHPLILPLAVALGCDMFDSASYMLYAKKDRYISASGTIRLEQLEYLSCSCAVCSSITAQEIKSLAKDERTISLAKHNLAILNQTMEEIKQAIWEGRLWELVASNSKKHPKSLLAFQTGMGVSGGFVSAIESGTPRFKERGLFVLDEFDISRPEIARARRNFKNVNLRRKKKLLILPETRTKPFLRSDIFEEVSKIVSIAGSADDTLITFVCPNYGLVPAELSDIYPLSQTMSAMDHYPEGDYILNSNKWDNIRVLATKNGWEKCGSWLSNELSRYFCIKPEQIKISRNEKRPNKKIRTRLSGSESYRDFKKMIAA